jgi:hypothetical protein
MLHQNVTFFILCFFVCFYQSTTHYGQTSLWTLLIRKIKNETEIGAFWNEKPLLIRMSNLPEEPIWIHWASAGIVSDLGPMLLFWSLLGQFVQKIHIGNFTELGNFNSIFENESYDCVYVRRLLKKEILSKIITLVPGWRWTGRRMRRSSEAPGVNFMNHSQQ